MALVRTYSALDLPSVGPYSLTRTYSVPSLTSYTPVSYYYPYYSWRYWYPYRYRDYWQSDYYWYDRYSYYSTYTPLYYRSLFPYRLTTFQTLITGIIPTIIGAVTKAISMIMTGHTITDVGTVLPIIFEQEDRRRMYKSQEN
uniref:Uncharacterized protein n=1 Tax=Meloidogyne floridensis TaxID=298350 RepID=A0A915P9C8_9BILA